MQSIIGRLEAAQVENTELWDALEDKELVLTASEVDAQSLQSQLSSANTNIEELGLLLAEDETEELQAELVRTQADLEEHCASNCTLTTEVESLNCELRAAEARIEELSLILVAADQEDDETEELRTELARTKAAFEEQSEFLNSELRAAEAKIEELSLLLVAADQEGDDSPVDTKQLGASVRFPDMTMQQWNEQHDTAFVEGLSRSLSMPVSAFGAVTTAAGSVIASVEFASEVSAEECGEALKSLSFEDALEHEAFEPAVIKEVPGPGSEESNADLDTVRTEAVSALVELARLEKLLVQKSLMPFCYFYQACV